MTPVEFRGDVWRQKTRVPGLSCGVVGVILCLAVLVELRLVADRRTQTDGQTQAHGQYRGCIASRGKNQGALGTCPVCPLVARPMLSGARSDSTVWSQV